MTKKRQFAPSEAAVVHQFDAETSDGICYAIRHDVDAVLSSASDGGITPLTPNNDLLSAYIIPDNIPALYVLLNRRLSKYDSFKLFKSNEIKSSSSVGEVRQASYDHCGTKCSHV